MRSSDGRWVLNYNGELYNHPVLRRRLAAAGVTFRGGSDTEVLLAAVSEWGLGPALEASEGMFALALWDRYRRQLHLARDRFGEKPLYYAPLGPDGRDGLVFASELRALLLHPSVAADRAVDPAAVAQFFLHEFVPAPRTILSNVRKLPAGSLLRWRDGAGLSIGEYYAPPRPVRAVDHAGPAAEELVRLVSRSTGARLVADVPVGLFLSGGLDSSFLAACAVQAHPRVRTFTVGFDDPSFDESAHARQVARHLGTEHTEIPLRTSAMLDLLPGALDWMDEPFADSSLLPTTLLAREVRREVTVALGGEGGDELLGGYPTFVVDQYLLRLASRSMRPTLAHGLGRLARQAARLVPADPRNFSPSFKARQLAQGLALVGASGARRHASWLAPLLPTDLVRLAGPRLRDEAIGHAWDAVDTSASGSATPFDQATRFYLRLYLAEGVLAKVDRATMRASLEARAPLLDRSVVDFCLSLAPELCVRRMTTKRLMRIAAAKLLPDSILGRPKKGFGAPVGAWLQGPLRPLVEATLHPDKVRDGGWLDPKGISKMVDDHVSGRADLRKPLYAALVFEHWRQRWSA